jgi:hypothetical protein
MLNEEHEYNTLLPLHILFLNIFLSNFQDQLYDQTFYHTNHSYMHLIQNLYLVAQ